MFEKLNIPEQNRAPRILTMRLGAILLVLSGCAVKVDANNNHVQKLEVCGGAAVFDQKSEKKPKMKTDTSIKYLEIDGSWYSLES